MKDVPSSGIAHNALASGTLVKGDIHAEEDLRIDGKVEGTINCAGKVVVGPQAEILGDIQCANVDVTGRVTGNLVIKERATLRASCVFTGDLAAGSLEITPGAVFNGSCKIQ